jgi:LPS sulfotransferase NodH
MIETEFTARYPTRFERAILVKADAWIDKLLSPGTEEEKRAADATPAADPRLILLCFTPRSGSTALSALLDNTNRLGSGSGERLNRKNKVLHRIAAETRPRTRRELLERVIDASRTRNGVAQIKCDLPQLLPFLLDPGCFAVLRQARFVYLTRGDILGQAISRHRSISTGLAHLRRRAEDGAAARTEAPYSFDAILGQIERLTRMMAAYEKVFALLGISPLRITYEQLLERPGEVVRDIGRLVGVGIRAAAITSLDSGGHRKVASANNESLRDRFLQDAQRRALTGH